MSFLTLNRDIVSSPFLIFHLPIYGQFTEYKFMSCPLRRDGMTKKSKVILFGNEQNNYNETYSSDFHATSE